MKKFNMESIERKIRYLSKEANVSKFTKKVLSDESFRILFVCVFMLCVGGIVLSHVIGAVFLQWLYCWMLTWVVVIYLVDRSLMYIKKHGILKSLIVVFALVSTFKLAGYLLTMNVEVSSYSIDAVLRWWASMPDQVVRFSGNLWSYLHTWPPMT